LLGFPGSTAITNSIEALFLDCDILVPAASEMQIHRNNCDFIKAKVIAEAANGPVTVGAEEHLLKQNKMIIPDLLLNAGGVTVSYFEWLKNLSHVRFGRINKKWEEHGKNQLVEFVETEMGRRLSPEAKQAIVSGADEEMLVHSGLEDTMINAVKETRNTARAKVLLICWLEEACHLLVAIDVVALKLCVSIFIVVICGLSSYAACCARFRLRRKWTSALQPSSTPSTRSPVYKLVLVSSSCRQWLIRAVAAWVYCRKIQFVHIIRPQTKAESSPRYVWPS